ncbi:haloalkane dehalogenase [Streptomyces sp. NPDC026672]|uniref:haloalkane dehalogenase n=1 Tax=unclassified Streptomyces TaxID=2593676 RepID=UPI0033F1F077
MTNRPYAEKKFAEINGVRMAYIDEGEGDAIVFQHGNPTSSYLWRNVMPYLEGLGRLIACDLVGMGDSGRLHPSGPDRYTYQEQRDHLFALWEHLDLGDNAVLVLHDWGSALGFDWAFHHQHRVAGLAYMEAIVAPMSWEDWRQPARDTFQRFRSSAGEAMVLTDNMFVEGVLPRAILRRLDEEEMAVYREPYRVPGESRRPTLSWPRQLPIDGEPQDVVRIVEDYGRWLAGADVPKLFVNAEPGAILIGAQREFCRTWPNQTEVTVPGLHFVQEDSPHSIGAAVADFVRDIRGIDHD